MGTCVPLRRKSFSAPSSLVLDGCIASCIKLSGQVDQVIDQARRIRFRSISVADLTMSGRGQCHQCHRPVEHPDHIGVMPGLNKCTLSHFDLCPGGKKTQKDWAGCPEVESENASSLASTESKPTGQVTPASGPAGTDKQKAEQLDPNALASALMEEAKKAEQVVLDTSGDESDDEDTDDEEERLLQADIERLKLQVVQENQSRLDAEEKRKKEEKKRLKRDRLAQLAKQKADLINQSKAFRNKSSNAATVQTGDNSSLNAKAADLASKQQRKNAENNHKNLDGLTIAGIRALPGMTPAVEEYLLGLQSSVPSLSKTPTANTASGTPFQPAGVLRGGRLSPQHSHTKDDEFDTDYVYIASLGKLVPVVRETPSVS